MVAQQTWVPFSAVTGQGVEGAATEVEGLAGEAIVTLLVEEKVTISGGGVGKWGMGDPLFWPRLHMVHLPQSWEGCNH